MFIQIGKRYWTNIKNDGQRAFYKIIKQTTPGKYVVDYYYPKNKQEYSKSRRTIIESNLIVKEMTKKDCVNHFFDLLD